MVSHGYHYTSEANWRELQDSSLQPRGRLVPLKLRFDKEIPDLPDWAHDAYIFAFPDSEAPSPWKNHPEWKYHWDILTAGIGERIIGIRFVINPSDEAYVVDRAHFADYQEGRTKDKRFAIRNYALSRIPASEYCGNYRMPELLINNPISLDRLVEHSRFRRCIVRDKGDYTIRYRPY